MSYLIINDFNKITSAEQYEIQDFISGITPNYEIVSNIGCDVCSKVKPLCRIDTNGGVIHICYDCRTKKGDTPSFLVETKKTKLCSSAKFLFDNKLITCEVYESIIRYLK